MFLKKTLLIALMFFLSFEAMGSFFREKVEGCTKELNSFQDDVLSSLRKERIDDQEIPCFVLGRNTSRLSREKLLRIASFDEEGVQIRENDRGIHPVFSYKGAHYKAASQEHSIYPLRELAAYFFQRLLVGEGIPPSFFMCASLDQGKNALLQVSQTVQGNTFHQVMEAYISASHFPPKKKLDLQSLSAYLFVSFVLSPWDAKPDNFIVDQSHRLISIDNDQNFSSGFEFSEIGRNFSKNPFLSDSEDEESSFESLENSCEIIQQAPDKDISIGVSFRNIFCLCKNFMTTTVDEYLWKQIGSTDPCFFMIEWFSLLEDRNDSYTTLKGFQKFISEELHKSLPPALEFLEIDMVVLYHRLSMLCRFSHAPCIPTFEYIFHVLNPLVALYYENLVTNHKKPYEALADLYQTSIPFSFFISKKAYISEGRDLDETVTLWIRKYREHGQKKPLNPREVAKALFGPNPFFYESLVDKGLTPRALRFLYGICHDGCPYLPWDIALRVHEGEQGVLWPFSWEEGSFQIDEKSLENDPHVIFYKEILEKNSEISELALAHASQTLTHLLMGRGGMPSLLIQDGIRRMLVLQKPRPLSSIQKLEGNENLMDHLDPQSTSELLLSSMIVNIALDGPENFYLCQEGDQYHLIRFDHRGAFRPTLTKDEGKIYSFLFSLKEMHSPIHPGCLEKILSYSPCPQSNKKGNSRAKITGILSVFRKRMEKEKIDISIGVMNRIQDRLYCLHNFLWKNSFFNREKGYFQTLITHEDVFCFLKPDLMVLREKHLEEQERKSLRSSGLFPSPLKNSGNGSDLFEGSSKNIKECVEGIKKNHKDFLKSLVNMREQKRASILKKSDFSGVKRWYLEELSSCLRKPHQKNRSLYFKNALELTNDHLKEMNFNYVSLLRLENCPKITEDFFKWLSQKNEKGEGYLVELHLKNLTGIINFGGWQQEDFCFVDRPSYYHFPYLRRLTLKNMPNLKAFFIDAPNLFRETVFIDESIIQSLKPGKNFMPKEFPSIREKMPWNNNIHLQRASTPLALHHRLSALQDLKELEVLDLRNAGVKDIDVQRLMEKVFRGGERHPSLTHIDLRYNPLTDGDVQSILDSFRSYRAQKSKKNRGPLMILLSPGQGSLDLRRRIYQEAMAEGLDAYFSSMQSDEAHEKERAIKILEKLPLSKPVKFHMKDWPTRHGHFSFPWMTLMDLDFWALDYGYKHFASQDLEQIDLSQVREASVGENFLCLVTLMERYEKIRDLSLNDIPFSEDQWSRMIPLIGKMKGLERLSLIRSRVPSTLISDLVASAHGMPRLHFFGLAGNTLGNECVESLKTLLSHARLETVDLQHNLFDHDAARIISWALLGQRDDLSFMPIFLFHGNPMATRVQEALSSHFAQSLLSRAFDHREPHLLRFFTHLGVPKSVQGFIKATYENPYRAFCPNFLYRMNFQALNVLGYGIIKTMAYDKRLSLSRYRFRPGDFPYLFEGFLHRAHAFERLDFSESCFQESDAPFIASFIRSNPCKKGVLEKTHLGERALGKILQGIQGHPTLRKFYIEGTLQSPIKNPEKFEKTFLTFVQSCPLLSKVRWDDALTSQDVNEKAKALLEVRYTREILDLREALEEKRLFLRAQEIISLFNDQLGLKQQKIADFVGVTQGNISQIKSGTSSGKGFLQRLDEQPPALVEQELLNKKDFFLRRYDVPKKIYRKIKNQKGFTFLLLSLPVKNPYDFVKDGLGKFINHFSFEEPEKIFLKKVNSPESLIDNLSNIFPQGLSKKMMGIIYMFFGGENLTNWNRSISYLSKADEKKFSDKANIMYFLGCSQFKMDKCFHSWPKESFLNISRSALKGHLDACYFLAHMYKEGLGCDASEEQYEKYLLEAKDKGHVQATYEYGFLSMEKVLHLPREPNIGREVKEVREKLRKEAFTCFEKAAEQGHLSGKVYHAVFHLAGWGVEKDLSQGFKNLKTLKDQNHSLVFYHLGQCYEKALGCQKNPSMAEHFYEKAMKLGNQKAAKKWQDIMSRKIH